LSDVHGNLDALHAVFQDIDAVNRRSAQRIGQIWFLGDAVGYGPQPSECVRLIRARCTICIAGNHDWAAVRKIDLEDFSKTAADSATWTQQRLGSADHTYLASLPETAPIGNFTLAHGSPANPIWEYLTTPDAAEISFQFFDSLYCVVGHTHLPTIFVQPITDHLTPRKFARQAFDRTAALTMAMPGGPSRISLESGEMAMTASRAAVNVACERWTPAPGLCMIPPTHRAIINPGSVGQPRDGDNRASYVIYDSELGFEFRRVPYNIQETQRKIREQRLPELLAERLFAAN
jgi:diadenosine tetraphosphatase ApaH/serine/threonine PP2A family protein phosphatase